MKNSTKTICAKTSCTKKLKTFFNALLLLSLCFVFTIGLLFTAEIVWRLFTKPSESEAIDVSLFSYKHYLVTTHPANLALGKSNHILERYFPKGVCAGPDGITARFNSDGFRTHDLRNVPPKEANELRIIITGGSVAISWNTGEACTLDARLYRLFEEKYPNKKVRIYNLGNGAWKSFQELLALQLYGSKLEPDLIIAFDGYNDIQHAFSMPIDQPYSNHANIAFNKYQSWIHAGVLELFNNFKIIKSLKQQAYSAVDKVKSAKKELQGGDPLYAAAPEPGKLATKIDYPFDFNKIATREDFDPYNQQAVNFYLMNERLMAKTASISKAKIIFALAPTLYLKTPLSVEERDLLNNYANSANFVIQGYMRIKTGLQKIATEENNATFYDMSNVFANNEQTIFGDSGHFNQKGYEIVANKLFEKIEETLKLKN